MMINPSAVERKERSERRLIDESVPINRHLPVIESEDEIVVRTEEEVALRALSLLTVAVKGHGLEQTMVEKIVGDYGLLPHLSPNERKFVEDVEPSEHQRIQFVWRYEAAWTLLWALGYVDRLGKPVGVCDVDQAVAVMKERSTDQFIAEARLRPIPTLLDEADLIYRYRWALVDARLKQLQPPGGLDPGVAVERHHALNWLVVYADEDWDDVSCDT